MYTHPTQLIHPSSLLHSNYTDSALFGMYLILMNIKELMIGLIIP